MPEEQTISHVETLKSFILPKFHYPLEREGGNNGYIILEENSKTKVRINQVPEDLVAIKLDKNNSFSRILFTGKNGETCCCDFVLICDTKKVIIFIEIKTNTAKREHIINQLKSTDCIFDYIQIVGKKFYNVNNFFDDYERKYIVFKKLSKKNGSKDHLKSYNGLSSYDKPLFLSGNNNVYFKRLIMEVSSE